MLRSSQMAATHLVLPIYHASRCCSSLAIGLYRVHTSASARSSCSNHRHCDFRSLKAPACQTTLKWAPSFKISSGSSRNDTFNHARCAASESVTHSYTSYRPSCQTPSPWLKFESAWVGVDSGKGDGTRNVTVMAMVMREWKGGHRCDGLRGLLEHKLGCQGTGESGLERARREEGLLGCVDASAELHSVSERYRVRETHLSGLPHHGSVATSPPLLSISGAFSSICLWAFLRMVERLRYWVLDMSACVDSCLMS